MIRNYIKTAFRRLWRNKAFFIINIAGLSVGLTSCMLIYLNTIDELSYDRFNLNAAKIYHLVVNGKDADGSVHRWSAHLQNRT